MPFTPEEIEVKEFVTRFRGYDREEVHAFLRALAADMRRRRRKGQRAQKEEADPQILGREEIAARRHDADLASLVEAQRSALASLLELLELRFEHVHDADRDMRHLTGQARATYEALEAVSDQALRLNRAGDEGNATRLERLPLPNHGSALDHLAAPSEKVAQAYADAGETPTRKPDGEAIEAGDDGIFWLRQTPPEKMDRARGSSSGQDRGA